MSVVIGRKLESITNSLTTSVFFCGSLYTIDNEEEKKMLHRVELLKETLAARQKVHLTLVTTFGLVNGKHSGKVQKVVTCDDLFAK